MRAARDFLFKRGRVGRYNSAVSAERLRECLLYDPETGIFTWRESRPGPATAGSVAGTDNGRGYILISVDRVRYKAHRLAWLYVYGEWPSREVDHINLVRNDNRIANLRQATPSQQTMNSSRRRDNSSGFRGVAKHSDGKWQATLTREGRRYYLGLYKTAEEAAEAYNEKARELFGSFYRAAAD